MADDPVAPDVAALDAIDVEGMVGDLVRSLGTHDRAVEADLMIDILEAIARHRGPLGKRKRRPIAAPDPTPHRILYSHWSIIMSFVGLSPDLNSIMLACKLHCELSVPIVERREVLLLVGNARKFDANQNVQFFDPLTNVWASFPRFRPDWVRVRIKAKVSVAFSPREGVVIPSDHLRWNRDLQRWTMFRNVHCDSFVFCGDHVWGYQVRERNFSQEFYLELTLCRFTTDVIAMKTITREFYPVIGPRSPQFQGAVVVLPSNQIGFFGGSPFITMTSCCLYDPSRDSWTDLPDLPIRVFNNTATIWRGSVVVAGGSRTRSRWSFNNKVWLLDLSRPSSSWSSLPDIPREHGHCMLATLNSFLVALLSTSVSKPAVLYRFCPGTHHWIQLWSELHASANSSVSKDGVLVACPRWALFPRAKPIH